jgi:hypothetical protein
MIEYRPRYFLKSSLNPCSIKRSLFIWTQTGLVIALDPIHGSDAVQCPLQGEVTLHEYKSQLQQLLSASCFVLPALI